MKKGLIILLCLIGLLEVGNLVFLDWQYISKSKSKSEVQFADWKDEEDKLATASCELSCKEIIEEEIQQELAKLPALAGQSSVSPAAPLKIPTQSNNKPKIVYVPLITDGSVSAAEWTGIVPSEFYFDPANYPSAKEFRFEAYLSSANDDRGFARLYDATNKRGVDFSDLSFNKSEFTRIESSAVKIWNGNNKYSIQLRSVNGTKVQVKEAKLKIYY